MVVESVKRGWEKEKFRDLVKVCTDEVCYMRRMGGKGKMEVTCGVWKFVWRWQE